MIEAFLNREAVHATDDPAVHRRPLFVTDLSPLAAVFHLQKPLGDGNPFPVRIRGPDPHILHLHCHTLRHRHKDGPSLPSILRVTTIKKHIQIVFKLKMNTQINS